MNIWKETTKTVPEPLYAQKWVRQCPRCGGMRSDPVTNYPCEQCGGRGFLAIEPIEQNERLIEAMQDVAQAIRSHS